MVVELFNNPNYRHELFEMGLRPETGFGCAFWFLFEPNLAVQRMFADELAVLSDQFNVFGPFPGHS